MFCLPAAPYRNTWSSLCLRTNIPPATPKPGAPPAPPARTLFSPTMQEQRSPAYRSSPPTLMGRPLRNAESSYLLTTLWIPQLPASWGWTSPPHLPRDEAKKRNKPRNFDPLWGRSLETLLDHLDCRLQPYPGGIGVMWDAQFSLHFGHSFVWLGEWDGLMVVFLL